MSTVDLSIKCPNPDCDHEFEVEADVEPADPSYGADADGNRGIYVPASIIPPDDVTCPRCGADCTEEAKDAAEEFEPPEPTSMYDTREERDLDR